MKSHLRPWFSRRSLAPGSRNISDEAPPTCPYAANSLPEPRATSCQRYRWQFHLYLCAAARPTAPRPGRDMTTAAARKSWNCGVVSLNTRRGGEARAPGHMSGGRPWPEGTGQIRLLFAARSEGAQPKGRGGSAYGEPPLHLSL